MSQDVNLKNFQQVEKMLLAGVHPVVKFKKPIEDLGVYFEAEMKARLVHAQRSEQGPVGSTYSFTFVFPEFSEFNRNLEKPRHVEDDPSSLKTSSEIEMVPENQMEIVEIEGTELSTLWDMIETPKIEMFAKYEAERSNCQSYFKWLEEKL